MMPLRLQRSLVMALVLALGPMGATGVSAQQAAPRSKLLLTPSTPLPRDGTYIANDRIAFALDHKGNQVRLRFLDNDEVFYLSGEAGLLGGRVFKYDTGTEALQVTAFGAVTLYTDKAKNGWPAEYNDGDQNVSVDPPPLSYRDMRPFALKLAQDLSGGDDFAVGFVADWDGLARTESDALRGLACSAMRDAAYALDAVAKTGKRAKVVDKLHIVHVKEGAKAGASYQKGVLTVTYAPKGGASARPSSLVIARALEAAL